MVCLERVSATSRTAVYGPVRTVVWEGRSREAPPYPDRSDFVRCVGFRTPARRGYPRAAPPAAEKRQGRKSRVGNGGGAATMGVSPRAQASMWRNEAARYAILPRGMGVNWVVNGSRIVLVTQSCAFEFCRTATLT